MLYKVYSMLYKLYVYVIQCANYYAYSKLKGVLPLAACSDGITAAKNCPKYTCTYNKQVRLG